MMSPPLTISVASAAPAPAPRQFAEPSAAAPAWTLGRLVEQLVRRSATIRYCATRRRFLFEGEGAAMELAELLELVRRRSAQLAQSQTISVEAEVLALHHQRFFAADPEVRYTLNRAVAARDEHVAGDAISLRQYRSFLFFPANLLFRMDLAQPEAALAFAESMRFAADKLLARRDAQLQDDWDQSVRLRDTAAAIGSLEDPRLALLLEEQLLHNLMAHRAIFRQPACRGGDVFVRITDLPEEALAAYRASAAADERDPASLIFERAFMSTALTAAGANMYSRRHKKYKLVVRALGAGSGGRHFDGSVEGIWSGEEEVVFPPGTAFRVTRIEEGVASDCTVGGEPRTYIFLQEVSAAAASAIARGRAARRGAAGPLYLYGMCRELPDLLRKGAADVVGTVAAQRIPVVPLSSHPSWDATAAALAPGAAELPLDRLALAQRGSGLFRLEVEPCDRFLRWSELAADFALTDDELAAATAAAARGGATLDEGWLALEPVARQHWRGLEVWQEEEQAWAEVELPPVLPHVAGARQAAAPRAAHDAATGPIEMAPSALAPAPLELRALSREVQGVLDGAYKQPFGESYLHPRTGERVRVECSPIVEPLLAEVPRWTHGAMHAARTTVWGLLLDGLYRQHTGRAEPHLRELLLAMTHHDCARLDEGADYWDQQSGEQYAAYLEARGEGDAGHRAYFADAIAQKERRNTLARQLVQAADCLDILRIAVFLGPLRIQRGWQPRGAFNSDQLDLYRVLCDAEGKEAADALLRELHHFIRLTEVPEVRVWFESRVEEMLLELLGAMTDLHERHGCYPLLMRQLAPYAAQLPPERVTPMVRALLDDYYQRITDEVRPADAVADAADAAAGAAPDDAAADAAAAWLALWQQERWRIRRT